MRNKYSLTILCEHLPINFFKTHFNSLKAQINELFQMNFNSLKAWINELIQMHFYRIQSIKSLSCQVIYSHKWQSPFNAYIFMVVCPSCSTSYVALEHPQQMWDMCQMLNIWHISHTKHKKQDFSRCCICCIILAHIPFCVRTIANL